MQENGKKTKKKETNNKIYNKKFGDTTKPSYLCRKI